jgi:hypothetical protein
MNYSVGNFKVYNDCDCKEVEVNNSSFLTENKFGQVDIIFLIDSSSSMNALLWAEYKLFLTRLFMTLPISKNEIRIGIIQFATTASVVSSITFNVTNLLSTVSNMVNTNNGTRSNGHLGINLALAEFANTDISRSTFFPKIIISLSDGGWTWTNYSDQKTSIAAAINQGVQLTFIVKDSLEGSNGVFPPNSLYTYQPYYIATNNTFETDFYKIVTFISVLSFLPIINLSRYFGIGGSPISFGGNVSIANNVLQYNLPSTLFASTTLNTSLNTISNGFIIPYSCILFSASGYSSIASSTATASIHINGSVTPLTTITAGNFTNTGYKTFTLRNNNRSILAGSLIEIRVNIAPIGNCQINLYIA